MPRSDQGSGRHSEILEKSRHRPQLYLHPHHDQIIFSRHRLFCAIKNNTVNLGTLVYVQNKNTEWNTYLGTTDFESMSQRGSIPASALTVIPGTPQIINLNGGADIVTGDTRTFSGTFDKSVLATVKPGSSGRQIFILNPTLQIKIPAKTVPGRYRGQLTITSL